MNPRAVRLARGAAVTATAVALASTAHLLAGGAAPGLAGLAIAFVLGTVLGTAVLSGHRLTVVRTAATIVGGQAIFHAVFTWGAGAPMPGASPSAHAHALTSAFAPLAQDAVPVHSDSGMLIAHVVAGLLSLAVLLVEQRLLDRLVDRARRAVLRVLAVASPALLPIVPLRLSASRISTHPATAPAPSPALRRGPPVPAFAF